ncbi:MULTISPECIES: ATP-binding protein [Novosphingobium]|uniref:ATP-binding protein n=1 Tax=Novosphingobium sp. ST904 TaxID=1684385 RepID=UPI000A54C1D7|nr:ATP-binding protein [Novosphingobium sp. ST904]TCM41298.1 signal transduction histidine kinase [Novosphingobium sp. ST904]
MTMTEPDRPGLFKRLRDYPRSLAGRLTLVLSLGMAASAVLALQASDSLRHRMFRKEQVEAALKSAEDIAHRYDRQPEKTEQVLSRGQVLGAHGAGAELKMTSFDPAFSRRLSERLGRPAFVMPLLNDQCFAQFSRFPHAAGMNTDPLPDCWFVRVESGKGAEYRYVVDLWPDRSWDRHSVGPPYLELIIVAGALLGLLAASLATTPLRRMERAARSFSLVGDFEPIPVKGPSEVRAALETFNLAQERVREGLRERTQILASVTHDLQTPLTRLRLRLEQVEDEALRDRLVADLAITQQIVRNGLDLARSSEMREPWAVLDIDSILSSIAEDAGEFGHRVVFARGCGAQARVKPNALARALGNLVDNALKYGGSAELSCLYAGNDLLIRVADRGPGLDEDELTLAFQPFRRLSSGKGSGTGIGLAIAQAQVGTFGATLALRNRDGGGLVAEIEIPGIANPPDSPGRPGT